MLAKRGRSLAVNKRKILESAQKHLQRGALDKALEDYQTLLKADPKDSNIRLKVGDLHLKLGRAQDAIESYLRVAQQFTNEGFDAKAVALYKQVTKLDEKRFEVNAQLGELYQRMGLTSEAMKATQLAADGAHRAGDKSEAMSLLRRMAALDPTNTTSRLKVAELLQAEGKTDDALAEYDEVVRELERQNNTEQQIKVLERSLEFAPDRVETLRSLARAAIVGGAATKAEKAARTLVALSPQNAEAQELLGTALERAGRADEAAEVFLGLADSFRQRGDEDRARELVQRYGVGRAFEGGDSDPPVLEGDAPDLELDPELDASLGLDDTGDLESSGTQGATPPPSEVVVDDLPTPAEADPDADFDQLLAEASVFSRYGKHERAIEALRAALRVERGSAAALEKLGESLAAIGNRAHACSALARAGAAYADAGDAEGVERVRSLLAPLDARAAAALAVPSSRATAVASADALEPGEFEIEFDSGLDDETLTPEPSAAPASGPDEDFSGIEIDVSNDLVAELPSEAKPRGTAKAAPAVVLQEDEFSFDVDDVSEPTELASESEKGDVSASVQADLEEAEFYRQQGLADEARALYERVLAAEPDHALARASLAELAVAAQPLPAPSAPEPPLTHESFELDDSEHDAAASDDPTEVPAAAKTPTKPAFEVETAPPPQTSIERSPVASVRGETTVGPLGGADFDLAAELSGALDDASLPASGAARGDGDGFEEVFAAFKAGVRREVGDSDFEAHFDLGIAYKEMGLLEDAIGEFRVALGAPGRGLACLHLMGVCALELGRASDAIAHLSEALARGELPAQQEAALRADLGRAYQGNGELARARSEFEAARAADPGFAGIELLLEQLAAAAPASAPVVAETFESFDDFLEEHAHDAASASQVPAPQYESFDELQTADAEPPAEAPAPAAAAGVLDLEQEVLDEASPLGVASVSSTPDEAPAPAPEPMSEPPPVPRAASPAAPRRKKKISFV